MRTFLVIAILLAFQLGVMGQEKVSKKEQKVLLKEEQAKEERVHAEYESILANAHNLFQARQYEEAKFKYQEALKVQPSDAYAKAKVNDLEIIIAYLSNPPKEEKPRELTPNELAAKALKEKEHIQRVGKEREALMKARNELASLQNTEDEKTVEVRKEIEDVVSEIKEDQVESKKAIPEPEKELVREEPEPVKKKVTPTAIKAKEEKVEKALDEFQKELARQYPVGMTEENFMDGNVEITKRIIVSENKGNEYKRAKHPWGATYYFKNELPITSRKWEMETDKYLKR